ncbi:MAG: hypothetical protein LBC12_05185 [Nitrososphaerota archaeon]|jgi:hypothetical protein|nr:hypothetical protein [Nitrososphaerota archaeon]
MNNFVPFVLIFFFITGLFVVAFNSVSAAELFEDSWNTKAPMSHSRSDFGVVTVNGKICAIGGYTSYSDGIGGLNECYDPVTDTWATLEPMSTPRAGFAIAEYKCKIYCIGGENLVNVVEAYNVVTNSWSTQAPVPSNTSNAFRLHASVLNGKIFVINKGDLCVYMYDPVADFWTEKNRVLAAHLSWGHSIVLTVVDGKMIVIGEFYSGPSYPYEQKVLIYDPKTDTWNEANSTVIDTLHNFAGAATTGRYAPKRVYILGETGNYAYDPANNDRTTIVALPTDREGFGIAVIDDVLYIIGGYTISWGHSQFGSVGFATLSALNEQYVPIGYHALNGIFELSSIYVVVVLVLTVGIVGSLFFHLKKEREKLRAHE